MAAEITEAARPAAPAEGPGSRLAWRPGPELAVCDAHLHVFGPVSVYPTAKGTTSAPESTFARYLSLAEGMGIRRLVLVQPSAYGPDNRCLLDALDALGSKRVRGVVVVGDARPSDSTLEHWRALGVCGLRCICFPPGTATHGATGGADGGSGGAEGFAEAMRPVLERQAGLAAELGWHLDVLAPGWLVFELRELFEAMPADVCFAHLGMFPAEHGPEQPGFRWMLDLLSDAARRRFAKVTGPYRISDHPRFEDAGAMARAAYDRAPDRLVWGSDSPHLSFPGVRTADMLDLAAEWFPDEASRQAVLVQNATALYGFEEVNT
ncbi:MAG: amidohydrolase family protein [Acidimicrobiales bacterium]